MDKHFLDRYQQELKFFREASKEFALQHPQVAKRLGLHAPEIEDPYVERLIEAVSFLTARINLKIDAEYPYFVQHILKVIHPELTQPIPSAGVVALETNQSVPIFVPKLTQIVTHANKQGQAMCQFSTCQDRQLLPFNIQSLRFSRSHQAHSQNIATGVALSKSVLSFALHMPTQLNLKNIQFEHVQFYIHASELRTSSELLYFLSNKSIKLVVELADHDWRRVYHPKISLCGFENYLSYYNDRNINYLKHLMEYGLLAEKYLFFRLENLSEIFNDPYIVNLFAQQTAKAAATQPERHQHVLQFSFEFNESSAYLEQFLDENALSLNSVIINNAFKKKTRVLIDQHQNEQHVVLDKLRPNDYEVIRVDKVEGYSNLNFKVKVFESLYKLDNDTEHFDESSYGFFSETHKPTNSNTKKNSYKGSECYLTLTNQFKHVIDDDLSQLAVNVWCSNRGLPSEISWSLDQDLCVANDDYKITRVKRHTAFSQPLAMPADNASHWRLMNLIAANFLSVAFDDEHALTQQIKNSLYVVYEMLGSEALLSEINAIMHVSAQKITKVKRIDKRLSAVNGLQFTITVDEMLMSHVHPFLWGRILAEFLTSFAPINHFIELCLQSKNKTSIAVYSTL